MERRDFLRGSAALAAMALTAPTLGLAATGGRVERLPRPDLTEGQPLMRCLAERRTSRSLSGDEVDMPTLGALLWAAWGINRANGRHVIPTALDRRQLAVYAVRSDGVWEYLPRDHAIKLVLDGDRRGAFDGAGLVLLYAAPGGERFAGMHVGSMYQNVGLCCASLGLANCVKYQKHDALDAVLPLPSGWMTYITHSIAKPSR